MLTFFVLLAVSHSMFTVASHPWWWAKAQVTQQPLCPTRSLPTSFLPGRLGTTLMLGLLLFSWWLGPFIPLHFQFCSTVKMVRFKQLYCCYIFFLDCSLAPGLFLIYFLGLYSTLRVSAVFSLNGLCSFLPCWTDQRLFFPGTSPVLWPWKT